jgi:hypothetical protein
MRLGAPFAETKRPIESATVWRLGRESSAPPLPWTATALPRAPPFSERVACGCRIAAPRRAGRPMSKTKNCPAI